MKRIFGLILVKETNKGIPNLVVAAFDSEMGVSALGQDLTQHEIESDPDTWRRFGKRMGSVLTNENGRFEFNNDSSQFSGGEPNPNLLIAVFAPEDVADAGQPFPLSSEKRILYVSSMPRYEAGTEEAYIIRLGKSQLDKFAIAGDVTAPSLRSGLDPASSQYVNAIERSYIFKDNLKILIKPRLQAQLDNALQVSGKAKTVFKNLSAISAENRKHPQLLLDNAQLPALQKGTISDGLARLNKNAPGISMSLSEEEVASFGLKVDGNGVVSGPLSTHDLADFLTSKIGGVDLIYRNSGAPTAQALLDAQVNAKSEP